MSTMEKYNKSRDHKFTLDSNGLLTVSNLNDLSCSINRDRDFSSKPTSIYTSASPNGHRHSPQRKLKPIDTKFKSKSHVSPPLPPLRPAPVLSAAVMDSNKTRKNLNKINLKTINTITNSRNGKNTPPSSQPPPVPPFPASLAAKSRSKALASLTASASHSNSSSSTRKSPSPGSSRTTSNSSSNSNSNSLSKASSVSRSRSISTSTSIPMNTNSLRSLTLSPCSPEKSKKLGNLTQKLRNFHSPKRSQQSNSQHSTPRVISSPMLVQTSFPLASMSKYSPPRNINNNGTFGDYLISPNQSNNNNNSHDISINSNSNSSSLTSSFGIVSGNTSVNTTPRSSSNKGKSRNTSINSIDSMNSDSSSVYNGDSSKISSHKIHSVYGFNNSSNSNNSLTGKHGDVLYPNTSRTASTSHFGSKSTLHSNKSEETFVSNGSKRLSIESRKSRSQSKSPIFRSPSSDFKGRAHFNTDPKSPRSSSINSKPLIVTSHSQSHSHQHHRPSHRSHVNSGRRERAIIDAASSLCSVCGLPLSDTISYKEFGNGEQILELSCHHYVHEECLLLKMGFVPPERDKTSSASYFPDCAKCADGTVAIPCDDKVSDDIVTKFLSDPRYSIGDSLTSDLMLASPNNGSELSSPSIQTRRQQLGQLSDASLLSIAPPPRDTFKTHHKKQSRGSSVSAISSIISSVSETSPVMNSYPMPTIYTSIGSAWNSNFSLELLRGKFVDELCKLSQQGHVSNVNSSSENDDQDENEEKLMLSKSLIESFGNLRLFDKMKLSHDGRIFSEFYCYLFEHMLVMVNLLAKEFSLMSISSLVHVDVPSKSVFKLMPNSDSNNKDNENIYFNCDKSDILEKWAAALSNLQSSFSNDLITSTISEEEYYDLLNYSEDSSGNSNNSLLGATGAGLKSSFGSASTKSSQTRTGGSPPMLMVTATTKLPPGVNPKFYESTINSIVLKKKPAKVVILLNQLNSNVASCVAIKNIVKSLLLIRIDIMMLFTSTNDLTGQSEVVLRGDIQKRYNAEEYTHFLGLVDEYASILDTFSHGDSNSNGYFTHSGGVSDDGVPCATNTANPSSSAKSNVASSRSSSTNNSNTVEKHLTSYVSQNSHIPLDDLVTIILSATTLEKLQHLPVINTLPIEISTTPLFRRHNTNCNSVSSTNDNSVSVATLANWDDAMEVICWHCGLEFDDSDFSSSDESDDSDLDK
ncbi:unnamed protein product [Ambrosiozyma monospora]|uniref:Unnamed protein product n=1 Tax=Ambrosiozyma monospora TaxID=43982 RepID=A0A9W7DJF1_AMBMO|nr:unnamed protein product [Ambrosiozyma monospora]